MYNYIVYNNDEILYSLNSSVDITEDLTSQGVLFVESDQPVDKVYLSAGKVLVRPENPTQLHGKRLLEVPANATVQINDAAYKVPSGGVVDLSFDQPGVYQIRVSCWPYLDKEFTVEN